MEDGAPPKRQNAWYSVCSSFRQAPKSTCDSEDGRRQISRHDRRVHDVVMHHNPPRNREQSVEGRKGQETFSGAHEGSAKIHVLICKKARSEDDIYIAYDPLGPRPGRVTMAFYSLDQQQQRKLLKQDLQPLTPEYISVQCGRRLPKW